MEPSGENSGSSAEVVIADDGVELLGTLTIPSPAAGLFLFAHGSGSSRLSSRNQKVARALNRAGFGSLLFDLLTAEESFTQENVFDIPLLAGRLVRATHWIRARTIGHELPLGYFGASTGAGAALWAAAELGETISSVVSRGGRPDLAMPMLAAVTAPTLLIVGENDEPVIELNQEALMHLKTGRLIVVPGATHLFEEPGTLAAVAGHAVSWFGKYFSKANRAAA